MNRFSLNPLFTKLLIASIILTIGWAVFMKIEIRPLTTDDIVRFEFAGTIDKVTFLLNDWREKGSLKLVMHSIYLDFVFIFLYTSALALGCLTFPSLTGKINLMNWGMRLYRFSLYAGLSDFLENLCLMKLLHGAQNSFYPMAAWGFAFVKFSIIVAVLVFLFRCILQWALARSTP
jgi:hypothetical protein